MDIIQLIITVTGFVGLVIYQHYKIKILKDKIKDQNQSLQNIQVYSDIINPELLKYRSEQYEKLIEKAKNIEVNEVQQEMEKELKKSRDSSMMVFKELNTLLSAFSTAMYQLPHDRRKIIINGMPDGSTKKAFLERLPEYEEFDGKMRAMLTRFAIEQLGSGGTENQKQNEK